MDPRKVIGWNPPIRQSAPATSGLPQPTKPRSLRRAERRYIYNKQIIEYLEWSIRKEWKEYEDISRLALEKRMCLEWNGLFGEGYTEQEEKQREEMKEEKKNIKTKLLKLREEYNEWMTKFGDCNNILEREKAAYYAMMGEKKSEKGNDTV